MLTRFGDHVRLAQTLGIGFRRLIDRDDGKTGRAGVQTQFASHLGGQRGQVHAQHFGLRRLGGRSGCDRRAFGFGVFATAQRDLQRLLLAFAQHDHLDRFANRRIGNPVDQIAGVVDRLAVKRLHHIARQHPGIARRTFGNIGDQRALGVRQADCLGHIRRHILNPHAQPAATGFAKLLQLCDDLADHVRRHRKPDPDRPAGGRQDRGVHADHIAIHVEQRPARVALVDRGIGLDEVIVGALQFAAPGRNDPGADRKSLPQRVAHRHDPIADPHRITVAKGDKGQRFGAFDLQQRDVGLGVGADQFRIQTLTRKELDRDLIGAFDHMVVGDDIAVGRDHKPRTQRLGPAGFLAAGTVTVLKFLEEFFKGRAFGNDGSAFGRGCDKRGCGDVDNRRADLFGQIGKTFGRRARKGLRGLRQGKRQTQTQGQRQTRGGGPRGSKGYGKGGGSHDVAFSINVRRGLTGCGNQTNVVWQDKVQANPPRAASIRCDEPDTSARPAATGQGTNPRATASSATPSATVSNPMARR